MTAGGSADTEESNKALARRWLTEGWARGNTDLADSLFAPEFTLRGERVGPDGPRRGIAHIRAAFADIDVSVNLQLAQHDMVATHFTARGRHVGPYRGVGETGRWAEAAGIQIWTVRDGLVVADWNVFDEWGLMAQLAR